ncbi:MAG: hypothetical protein ACJAX8_001550, partial [Flavobacteriales bacterium]
SVTSHTCHIFFHKQCAFIFSRKIDDLIIDAKPERCIFSKVLEPLVLTAFYHVK